MARYGTLREALGRSLARGRTDARTRDIWALRDVDLTVRAGELVGVVGRNGSGKSTLLKIIARITEPTAGVSWTRGRVGALLEVGTGFHPELTGCDNIYLNGSILGMSRGDVRSRFDEIVGFAGVERFLDTPLKRYSTGMHLRLPFAVAAFVQASIVAVDEVLAVGDLEFQQQCLGKLSELHAEGRTVLFVSHDLGAIAQQCERCLWIDGGSIVRDGATDVWPNIRRQPRPCFRPERSPTIWHGPVGLRAVEAPGASREGATALRRGDPLALEIHLEARQAVRGLDVVVAISDRRGTRILDEALSDCAALSTRR